MSTNVPDRLTKALADRYRIERELGQGGMATVYLAQDVRHDRKVAIKVLKPELAAVLGADRFVVEIKTTAGLQHPHILPLFDSGTADGFLYYVMPYIQGETIREKLNRETQFGIEEAVRITREVADALDYAHRSGVIHRDIKPENILLHDGRALVMDFGIALAVSAAAGGRMTETGLSLGTPHYMSPEQATAEKDLTPRSDIYSLGCVLYEMLAGQPPHLGGSAQQVIMKIVTDVARPVSDLRKSVPPNVAAAVATALEKIPADRFENAKAFADALLSPGYNRPGAAAMLSHSPGRQGWRQKAALPAIGTAIVALASFVWAISRPSSPPEPVSRYSVTLADSQALSGTPWSHLALSPDGSNLVYVGRGERGSRLFLRKRDQLTATPLVGTDGAINPSFSPSGDRVAFMADQKIKVVSLSGGPPTTITDSAVGLPGVAWGKDGFIYYDRIGIGPLMRVPESGGTAQGIGKLDSTKGELQHAWPDGLPNGRGVIMTLSRGGPGSMGTDADEIGVLDLATGTHRALVRGVFARYARSGHLVYVTASGTLMAVRFDQNRMMVTGEPVALAEGVRVSLGGGQVDLALSETGTLWYSAGRPGRNGSQELVWVGREGSTTPVAAGWFGLFEYPALSPDGRRLAFSSVSGSTDLWIRDLDHGTISRMTAENAYNSRPAWKPDGKGIAFVSNSGIGLAIKERSADASSPANLVLKLDRPEDRIEEVTFSRDQQWMIYRAGTPRGAGDIYARKQGNDSSIRLVATPADEREPRVSPDGRWLAYTSNESGQFEVYVRPFPETAGRRWQVSAQGGSEPVWAHSGRELFYRTLSAAQDSQMVVQVLPGRDFTLGARRGLFPLTGFLISGTHQSYDIAPGDQRFLMIRTPLSTEPDRLVVIEGFLEELRSRVGAKP